jgi:hypothetical protein
MTDPRNVDPRWQDHQFSDPVRRHDQSVDRMWGWVAGLAVVVLIVFIVIVGWNAGGPTNTASNAPASTTGQGSSALAPTPGRSAPAPQGTSPAPSPSPAPGNGTQ